MKYSLLDQIAMESEYNSMRLNHFMQCNIDNFAFETVDIYNDAESGVITEHDAGILYENAFTDIVDKLMAFIQKIIDNIAKFFKELKIRIFGSPKEKEKLKKLKEAAKAAKNKGIKGNAVTKKVKIYKIKRNKKALDAYIKEMSQLERRMLKLKYQAAQDSTKVSDIPIIGKRISSDNTTASTMIEYAELTKAIDECNRKYDRIVKANAEVVELALNDAIRFSDKDLDSIGLDLEEIKKGSDRVLAKFKEDAKGVKTKQQANLIQKAVQSIETRVRKNMKEGAEYQTKNSTALYAFFAAAGIVSAGVAVAKITGTDEVIQDKLEDINPLGKNTKRTVETMVGAGATFGSAAALHRSKKELDKSPNSSKGGHALFACLTSWVNSGFPVGASIPKIAIDFMSQYMMTDKLDKIWKLAFALPMKVGGIENIYTQLLDGDLANKTNAQVEAFIKSHPKMGLDFDKLTGGTKSLTTASLRKFFESYAVNIAGVKDLPAFIKDMETSRKRFKEANK